MNQQKELVTKKDHRTGEETAYYTKGQPRETFYIPFTKKKVDEILGKHPFGPDSVNITHKDRVLYYGKFRYAEPPFRSSSFNYDEFTTWTFQQMLDKVKPRANIPLETELANAIRKLPQYT